MYQCVLVHSKESFVIVCIMLLWSSMGLKVGLTIRTSPKVIPRKIPNVSLEDLD